MNTHPDYEIFEELGRGESTIVYRGYDLSLDREVAIKELQTDHRDDPQRTERFLKEAQFLAQFEHENILRVYSVDAARGWIIMERMNGPLSRQMTRPLAPELIRSILRQILNALSFLHRKNKIHGAVRPGNLLINDEGLVKLSDFEDVTAGGELRVPRVSAKYLAPELLDSRFGEFGKPVDLYCLGFSVLEMFRGPRFDDLFPGTGERAVDAETAWLRWHSSPDSLVPVRAIDSTIPDDIADVLDRMLVKPVSERAPTADELLARLNAGPLVRVQLPVSEDVSPERAEYMARLRELGPALAEDVLEQPEPSERTDPKPRRPQKPAAPVSLRNRVNGWLSKPAVLYPTCAGIMALALWFVLWPEPAEPQVAAPAVVETVTPPPEPVDVTPEPVVEVVESEPPSPPEEPVTPTPREVSITATPPTARLIVNGDPVALDEGRAAVEVLEDDELTVRAELDGYEAYSATFDWDALTRAEFEVAIQLDPSGPELPAGLLADPSAPLDATTRLPLVARSRVLDDIAPLEFVLVPAGRYEVRAWGGALSASPESARTVTLAHPLYVATREVSIAQYAAFYRTSGADAAGQSWLDPARKWIDNFDADTTDSRLPATNMSAAQAEGFCQWLGGRLPSETEWEAAASYQFGFNASGRPTAAGRVLQDDFQAAFRLRTPGADLIPQPVDASASDQADAKLLHVMGNVAERCSDVDSRGGSVVKGCSFLIPTGKHVQLSWRAPGHKSGEWDIGIRVIIPVEGDRESFSPSEDSPVSPPRPTLARRGDRATGLTRLMSINPLFRVVTAVAGESPLIGRSQTTPGK